MPEPKAVLNRIWRRFRDDVEKFVEDYILDHNQRPAVYEVWDSMMINLDYIGTSVSFSAFVEVVAIYEGWEDSSPIDFDLSDKIDQLIKQKERDLKCVCV